MDNAAARIPRIDPEWLTTFLEVAEQGGVLAAARVLRVSQPTLSARLQKLEGTLGKPLFVRSPLGMGLTVEGQRLLPVARRLTRVLGEAFQAVNPEAGVGPWGPLRLAVSTTLANHVLPGCLAELVREQKVPGVEMQVGNTEEVLAAVRHGRVALGAVEGLSRAAGLRLEAFAQDDLLPVYAPDRLSARWREEIERVTTVKALLRLPVLWREPGSGTRRVVEEALRKRGVPPAELRASLVLGSTMALKAAVLEGMGLAFLPRSAIGQELALRRLVVVARPVLQIRRSFSWVLPTGALPPELEAFRRVVRRRIKGEVRPRGRLVKKV